MPNLSPDTEWISTTEAAGILGVSPSTVRRLVAENHLIHRQLPLKGSAIKLSKASVLELAAGSVQA